MTDLHTTIMSEVSSNAVSAGNLHQELWLDLLRRTDPELHNVRVTRGDGGLDGVGFQDPTTGDAVVYQAKFYPHFKDRGRRDEILEAFFRAHLHNFKCRKWFLLVPCELSHADLNWLAKTLRHEAVNLASGIRTNQSGRSGSLARHTKSKTTNAAKTKRSSSKPSASAGTNLAPKFTKSVLPDDLHERLSKCAVMYRDGRDLRDLLGQNLDVAGRLLPRSPEALLNALRDEQEERRKERAASYDVLRMLQESAIRTHAADCRRAEASLSILNQGWAHVQDSLRLALADSRLVGLGVREAAKQVEDHAERRSAMALHCEGVIPGVSAAAAEVHFRARALQSLQTALELGVADEAVRDCAATEVIAAIDALAALISRYTRARAGSS